MYRLYRGEGGDVDQSGHFGVVACCGDDCAAVGVADEDTGAVLAVDDTFGCCGIVFEAGIGVADYVYVVTVGFEELIES